MKAREILYGLGLRPEPVEYGYTLRQFELQREGTVTMAVWDHPSVGRRPPRLTQAMVDATRGFLNPGDAAVDVGAQYGDSTVPIALAVGPTGVVFALEPNKFAFKTLVANAELNPGKTRIVPLMFAATTTDGEFEFKYQDSGFCNGGQLTGMNPWRHGTFFPLQVQGRNLFNYLKQNHPDDVAKVRYIKIDTEGEDQKVAESVLDLITANRPYIKTEMYTHRPEEERRRYFRWLRDLGYELYKTDGEENYTEFRLDERDLMRWKSFDVFCVPEGR